MTMNPSESNWVGMFDQPNFGEYPVLLTIRDDHIRADYQSLPCGGFLRVEKIEEDVAYLKEYLSYGQERCLGGVEIRLSKREGSLRFVAMPPNGLPSGEAVLSRVPRSL
jgi:hypothetical protein